MGLPPGLLIEPDAVARIDAATAASGMDGYMLMSAAGKAVSAALLHHYPGALRHVVLCGPGNNGGDGYVAAADLMRHGVNVEIYALKSQAKPSADAQRAMRDCPQPLDIEDYMPRAGDVVVDAIFGAGLVRDVPDAVGRVIDRVSTAGVPVLAIDMPSGICGHAGAIRGGAFRAEVTVTFMAAKPGQLLLPGREYCGEVEIADIGVPDRFIAMFKSQVTANGPWLWRDRLVRRQAGSHKYKLGHLTVFSGGPLASGAARMAAEAALMAGAGLVSAASPSDALDVNANHLTAVMLKKVDDLADLASITDDPRNNAFVLGPGFGIGQNARDFAVAVSRAKLVLDADGITSFGDNPKTLFDAFADDDLRLVMTPHEGEFARLFPDLAKDSSLSKIDKALAAARRCHGVVVYKGADTVIAAPDGRAAINTNAPPQLATAGSGDVLSGIIGALLANGTPAFEAAAAGVYIHGAAGRSTGVNLTAESLISHIHDPIT